LITDVDDLDGLLSSFDGLGYGNLLITDEKGGAACTGVPLIIDVGFIGESAGFLVFSSDRT
jgi:hypothetical protein